MNVFAFTWFCCSGCFVLLATCISLVPSCYTWIRIERQPLYVWSKSGATGLQNALYKGVEERGLTSGIYTFLVKEGAIYLASSILQQRRLKSEQQHLFPKWSEVCKQCIRCVQSRIFLQSQGILGNCVPISRLRNFELA